jgi:hypothetical protein
MFDFFPLLPVGEESTRLSGFSLRLDIIIVRVKRHFKALNDISISHFKRDLP